MSRRGGRSGHSIAGAALRNAGLVDGDVGMRDAAGPSRSRGAGAGGRRGGRSNGTDPSNPVSRPTLTTVEAGHPIDPRFIRRVAH